MNEDDDPKLLEAAEALTDRTPYPWDAVASDDSPLAGLRLLEGVARAHRELLPSEPAPPAGETALSPTGETSPSRIPRVILAIVLVLVLAAAAAGYFLYSKRGP